MFDFIKKLFGGIIGFFGGLFGGKKSLKGDTSAAPKTKKGKGYFLELEDSGNSKAAEAKKPEPAKAETAAQAKKPEPVKAAVATAAPPKAEPAAPAKKPEPPEAKTEPPHGKVKIGAPPQPPAAHNGKAQGDSTFAPNYLLPTASNSRRRPGPSLDMVRGMARQGENPG